MKLDPEIKASLREPLINPERHAGDPDEITAVPNLHSGHDEAQPLVDGPGCVGGAVPAQLVGAVAGDHDAMHRSAAYPTCLIGCFTASTAPPEAMIFACCVQKTPLVAAREHCPLL